MQPLGKVVEQARAVKREHLDQCALVGREVVDLHLVGQCRQLDRRLGLLLSPLFAEPGRLVRINPSDQRAANLVQPIPRCLFGIQQVGRLVAKHQQLAGQDVGVGGENLHPLARQSAGHV